MIAGSEVLIWGGVSHLEHGRIENVDRKSYEQPFAMVRLRRKGGELGAKSTLVPLARCHTLPPEVVAMIEADREAWLKRRHPDRIGEGLRKSRVPK
jgi:hypothetical protein